MTATEWTFVIAAALVVIALIALFVMKQRQRRALQERFGPEYDRTVEQSDKRRDAERELADRAERRKELEIRPLSSAEREGFAERWRAAQEEFVDRPPMAVRQADLLVAEVMAHRGYPVGDFDQQARDVSVDHAHVVEEYRAAHDISLRNDRNEASTEDLRQAMVHYRALFSDLLSDRDDDDDRRDDVAPQDGGYADDEPRTTQLTADRERERHHH